MFFCLGLNLIMPANRRKSCAILEGGWVGCFLFDCSARRFLSAFEHFVSRLVPEGFLGSRFGFSELNLAPGLS